MTPKEKAKQIVAQHYAILFDSDSDKGQEVLVSLLAVKSALVTANYLLEESSDSIVHLGRKGLTDKEYWNEVLIEMQLM
jgi:hypothetical protein